VFGASGGIGPVTGRKREDRSRREPWKKIGTNRRPAGKEKMVGRGVGLLHQGQVRGDGKTQ